MRSQKQPQAEASGLNDLRGVPVAAGFPLSRLAEIDPKLALVGEHHLIDAHNTGRQKKVALAIRGDKILVSLGERSGVDVPQHWQLVEREGAALHPEARTWLKPDHRPVDDVQVLGTSFRVENGTVILGAHSLLFPPSKEEEDNLFQLTAFLQRVLDSKLGR